MPGAPRTNPDVQFSSIRFLCCTRLRVELNHYANTLWRRFGSVMVGRAIPKRSSARVNVSQVKLLFLPPLRLSHLKVQSLAHR